MHCVFLTGARFPSCANIAHRLDRRCPVRSHMRHETFIYERRGVIALLRCGHCASGKSLPDRHDCGGRGFFMPKKPTAKHILLLRSVCVICGVLGVVGQGLQARRGSKSGEAQIKNMLGDSEHPPFVGVFSLPSGTKFIITNGSDYPAYVTGVQLWDDTCSSGKRYYTARDLAAHTAFMDDNPWMPPLAATRCHFTASIGTRAGLYTEEMMLKQESNNQWARAVRVTQGMRTLEEDVDSAWPREPDGSIEWTR